MTKRKTDAPDTLTDEERTAIKEWCKEHHPKKLKGLGDLWPQCRDWHLSNGVQRVSWEATFRNWIRTSVRFDREREENHRNPYKYETPQEPRDKGEMTPIMQIIKGGKSDEEAG